MKRTFKLTFVVEFDVDNDAKYDEPLDPVAYMNERSDALAEGLDDVLECYDFITKFEKIEEEV